MNKTQCPHCFTVYVISDEQLRVSQGMVRCGNCKERFHAELLGEKKVQPFDPRKVFIEPISDQVNDDAENAANLIKNTEQVDFKFEGIDENLNSELSIDMDCETPSDHTSDRTTSISFNESEVDNYEFSEDLSSLTSKRLSGESVPIDTAATDTTTEVETDQDSENFYANDGELIDEVNQLIENKIIKPVESEQTSLNDIVSRHTVEQDTDVLDSEQQHKIIEGSDDGDNLMQHAEASSEPDVETDVEPEFSLAVKAKPKRPIRTMLFGSILLLFGLGLSAGLAYQLWLKQVISLPNNDRLNAAIGPIIEPLKKPVAKGLEQFDLTIPERRNLSRLELVSARTAPHPTRSSTILLRVSLINGAQISQPLPWLELSLNDSEGRLISRRGLSPNDYSHNNRIKEKIGPRELMKVTIELLKFPEQATGYELKLLDK